MADTTARVPLPQPPYEAPRQHLARGPHACQLAAASALVALTLQPDKHAAPGGAAPQYRGPFRELLLNVGLADHLLALQAEPWQSAGRFQAVRALAAAGLMALAAPGTELPRCHLQAIARHAAARAAARDAAIEEYVHLVATLWLLSRNAANLEYLQRTAALLHTTTELLRTGVGAIMHGGPLAQAAQGGSTATWTCGDGRASVATGIEYAVLVCWKLLQDAVQRRQVPGVPTGGSCYARTPTAWWQLRMDAGCARLASSRSPARNIAWLTAGPRHFLPPLQAARRRCGDKQRDSAADTRGPAAAAARRPRARIVAGEAGARAAAGSARTVAACAPRLWRAAAAGHGAGALRPFLLW